MEAENQPVNPHLRDLFRTAIDKAKAGPTPDRPSIIVNGSHNVISWGGTVYMSDADDLDATARATTQ